MKKLIFTTTLLLLLSGVVMAQRPRNNMPPKERAEQTTERMVKNYSLNEDQKAKVHVINLDMYTKISEISATDRETRRTEMQKIRQEYNTKLKQILSEEQYKAYEKDEAERTRSRRR